MNPTRIVKTLNDNPGIAIIVSFVTTITVSIVWPVLYEGLKTFQKPELVAKVNEVYSAMGNGHHPLYLLNISVVNIGKKVFYPRSWRAKIKYAGEEEVHAVELSESRHFEMPAIDIVGNCVQKRLKVERITYIQTNPIIQPQAMVVGYVAMAVPSENEDRKVDRIIFEIEDFEGSKQSIYIDLKNARENEFFYNDSIWDEKGVILHTVPGTRHSVL